MKGAERLFFLPEEKSNAINFKDNKKFICPKQKVLHPILIVLLSLCRVIKLKLRRTRHD